MGKVSTEHIFFLAQTDAKCFEKDFRTTKYNENDCSLFFVQGKCSWKHFELICILKAEILCCSNVTWVDFLELTW